ncbi:hypothetical protein Bbelb_035480 [Branchiostoma belcheri]|nr:hypothetical protein Bbelb_035480 [Branchiostoma belcheri]
MQDWRPGLQTLETTARKRVREVEGVREVVSGGAVKEQLAREMRSILRAELHHMFPEMGLDQVLCEHFATEVTADEVHTEYQLLSPLLGNQYKDLKTSQVLRCVMDSHGDTMPNLDKLAAAISVISVSTTAELFCKEDQDTCMEQAKGGNPGQTPDDWDRGSYHVSEGLTPGEDTVSRSGMGTFKRTCRVTSTPDPNLLREPLPDRSFIPSSDRQSIKRPIAERGIPSDLPAKFPKRHNETMAAAGPDDDGSSDEWGSDAVDTPQDHDYGPVEDDWRSWGREECPGRRVDPCNYS